MPSAGRVEVSPATGVGGVGLALQAANTIQLSIAKKTNKCFTFPTSLFLAESSALSSVTRQQLVTCSKIVGQQNNPALVAKVAGLWYRCGQLCAGQIGVWLMLWSVTGITGQGCILYNSILPRLPFAVNVRFQEILRHRARRRLLEAPTKHHGKSARRQARPFGHLLRLSLPLPTPFPQIVI